MIPENRIPTHPGEILLEEFLKPFDLTQVALTRHLGIPTQRVNEIVRGKMGDHSGNSVVIFAGV